LLTRPSLRLFRTAELLVAPPCSLPHPKVLQVHEAHAFMIYSARTSLPSTCSRVTHSYPTWLHINHNLFPRGGRRTERRPRGYRNDLLLLPQSRPKYPRPASLNYRREGLHEMNKGTQAGYLQLEALLCEESHHTKQLVQL
jgi:hypothetical protein